MRKDITVPAEIRDTRGKNEARRLRVRGMAPAVLYGSGQGSVALAVDPRRITRILHSPAGHNAIFDVAVRGGETTPAMIVDWQLDPLKESLLHVDLKRIDLSKRIRVWVPVHTQGDAKGVKQQDGLLEIVAREIEIECLPDEIPEHFTVDVTELMLGQAIRAGEVPMQGSMKLMSPPEAVVAHVVVLRVHEEAKPEAVAAEPAAPAEPEIIKKGKKEEEEEEKK